MTHSDIQSIGVRVADAAAAGCIGTAAAINLADINQIVQIGAGVVAIVAGLAAAGFHAYKTYDLYRRRNSNGSDKTSDYSGD